jgi:pteridine reductase
VASSKVALVTGSGKRRVGWHVAEALAKRGYAIAVHYHSSAAEAEDTVQHFKHLGVDAASFAADLTDEPSVRDLVLKVLAKFGHINVLVNTAAAWNSKRLEDVTAADVREFLDTNTLGTFLCCQHVGLAMTKQSDGGSIITFGDWASIRPYVNYAAYFPSKGAIPTLTRTLAVELAARNPRVRVNCILPGPVMLPPDLSADERRQVIQSTLVKREGSPENIALAVLHFVENDFITGACLAVDGGRSVYAADSGD